MNGWRGIKEVHNFSNCIRLEVNLLARLEFELVYYNAALQDFILYTTENQPYR